MDSARHLFPRDTGTNKPYTYAPKVVSSEFRTPTRDRVPHSETLVAQIVSAQQRGLMLSAKLAGMEKPKGIVLDFQSDPNFKLQLKSLEFEKSGIELRNSRVDVNGVMHATVFVPDGKVGLFIGKIKSFADPAKNTKKGKPANYDLVASISQIELAAIESFWTDAGRFPLDREQPNWWEVWLREATPPHDVVDLFRARARPVGAVVSERSLRFPDRRVVLVNATVKQLLDIENLFDILAELRIAKILAGEFLDLPPRNQAEFVSDARTRIHPPPLGAPAVCHLDTGINRGHPLLALALAEEHMLAVEPTWSTADGHPQQHGTGMAGLALYGCLTDLLNSTNSISLQHRLESVKILPDVGQHDPKLYGDVTAQSVSRIEIVAPERKQRAFALTITADSRDEGFPSSWSAALDQICSGAEDQGRPSRLLIVSAGNTPTEDRHQYPEHNQLHGVEDPAQSWNAISVGAYTEMASIHTNEFRDWKPVANAGQLSPSSRTSLIWQNRSWPIKPDIVMEGGNLAINPATGHAEDSVDDLRLLTTRTSPSGALLTTTGETSAATALAARYAAIIWARYPDLTPESVRGLLIHSARWTSPMLAEFPYEQRHQRLRVYGYGVPNLDRALWSAGNNATLIIQDSLQPYDQVINSKSVKEIKTKDMRLHRLPWPKDILEQLGGETIRMRVTLSYFIEPSPGQRGWKNKHRYQSHGLRFEIKRPTETDSDFLKRLTRSEWDGDEEAVSSTPDDRDWQIGTKLRCKGSIHSDVWTGSAAQLAASGMLAVYPVTGWWKERPRFERWKRSAKYSLIISLETDAVDVDLYTPIANQIGIVVAASVLKH